MIVINGTGDGGAAISSHTNKESSMKIRIASILAAVCIAPLGYPAMAGAQAIDGEPGLSARQQGIIPIAAFTAKGELEKLSAALNEGLDAGLSVSEIKEVLVQMYAYTGFPRSLDGLNTFMSVLGERQKKGIKDDVGKDASPLPDNKTRRELGSEIQTALVGRPVSGPVYDFAPLIATFLKEHLFADVFGRDVLDYQARELATVSALASLPAENQLRSHLNVSMNVGLSAAKMKQFVSVLDNKVGSAEAQRAGRLLDLVLKDRSAPGTK